MPCLLGMRDVAIHTVSLTMAYDGTTFRGFAQQPGQLTVQGSLNDALALLYKRPFETTGAGRTDSGVHARGQVVSFDLEDFEFVQRSLETLRRSLNALIDDRAVVIDIEERPAGFSARFDAKSREYRYFFHQKPSRPVLISNRVWHLGKKLDVPAMREGLHYLIGEHDFKSFCTAASAVGKPTCRKVYDIDIYEDEILGEAVLVFKISGNAFLHSMVRTIVGSLVSVGLGKKKPFWIEEALLAKNRSVAGETAPAQGLVFWEVVY